MKKIKQLLKTLDALIPQKCHLCKVSSTDVICDSCNKKIELSEKTKSIHKIETIFFCRYEASNIQDVFREIKFNNNKKLAVLLSKKLSESKKVNLEDTCLYVPVPSHKKRVRSRGFNHVQILFNTCVAIQNLTVIPLLIRKKNTRSLANLSPKERELELKGSLTINPNYDLSRLKNKKICIIDDIITTGATLTYCSAILEGHGFTQISAMCIASAH